jgi:hypothetical protein
MSLSANPQASRAPDDAESAEAEVKTLKSGELKEELGKIQGTATADQEQAKAGLKSRIEQTASKTLDGMKNPADKTRAADKMIKQLASQNITARMENGVLVVDTITVAPPDVVDAAGEAVDKNHLDQLKSLDVTPGDTADITKALAMMSAEEIGEVAKEALKIATLVGPDLPKLISFYNETDPMKKAAFLSTPAGKNITAYLNNPVLGKFFAKMDSTPLPASEAEKGGLGSAAEAMRKDFAPHLKKFMSMLKELKLWIDDFKASMDGGERLTDAGIDEDIASGNPEHRAKYKKKAMERWKTNDKELKDLGDETSGRLGDALTKMKTADPESEEGKALAVNIQTLRDRRTDLTKRQKKIEKRLNSLGVADVKKTVEDEIKKEKEEAEKKEKEAKAKEAAENLEKTEKAESAVKTINNVPKNDFVNASYTEASGLRLEPKGAQKFNDKLAAKLKALPGAIVKTATGKDTVYTTDISPENITRVVDIIKGEAVSIIDDNTVLKANEKKGLKAALAANGEWTEPISSPGGNQYNYIQAKDGTVYAQNVDGSSTWAFDGSDFEETKDGTYFSGELGDLVKKPSDTSSMTYDAETKTWVAMSKEANEARKVAIKTAGETYIKGRSDYSSTYGGDGHIINIAWDVDDVVFGFEDGEWVYAEQNDWDKGTRLSLSKKPGSSGNDYWSDNGISVINKALSKLKKINKGEAV